MIALVAVASIAIHGLIAVVVEVRDTSFHGLAEVEEPETTEAAVAEKTEPPNCPSRAALAAWARVAYCNSPMGGDLCMAELDDDYDRWIAECHSMIARDQEEKQRRDRPVTIALLDDRALEKLEPLPIQPLLEEQKKKQLAQPKPPPEPKQQQPQPPQTAPRRPQQVVEITQPDQDQAPDNARFLSEHNSRVEKEKVARGSTEKMVERPALEDLPVRDEQKLPKEPVTPQELAEADRPTDIENPKGTGKLDMRKPGQQQLDDLRERKPIGKVDGSRDPLAVNGLAPRRGERPRYQPRRNVTTDTQRGEGGEEGVRGRPKVPDLRPSDELLSRVVGGGSVDKLDGVESGEFTALNSKRWKHAGFFNRLKRQVAQNWHPNQVYLQRDPHGNVYGVKDRVTYVQVELRRDGTLAGIHVIKGSGVDFLDEEAVRAFRAAQPFPNPPEDLVDRGSKKISFSFGFHFQIGGSRDRWNIFRHR